MNAGYAPCAHEALFLHYAEAGLAIGLPAGFIAGAAAGYVLITRAIRKHKRAAA